MKKYLLILIALIIVAFCFTGCKQPNLPEKMPENFSFSITWGVGGNSTYDSKTGKLIKSADATDVSKYSTTYKMSKEELNYVYNLILDLNLEQYDTELNKSGEIQSIPPQKLCLTVNADDFSKTIKFTDADWNTTTNDTPETQFLITIKKISEILTNSNEWKELPDYEFYYE